MDIPVPFQYVFQHWERQGRIVSHVGWTNDLKRHYMAHVSCTGKQYFAKLAIAGGKDLDEDDMLEGMRREVWWSRAISALRERDGTFPFTSPSIKETNVTRYPFHDEVAWVIMEYIDGQPLVREETSRLVRTLVPSKEEQYAQLFDVAIRSLLALEKIHPQYLEKIGLPQLPSPPHGMRLWRKRGLLDGKTAVLGNGTFDVKNFWRTRDGTIVLMDNEFAGWYPKLDALAYLYHRLYCSAMRPDLARALLGRYLREVDVVELAREISLKQEILIDDQLYDLIYSRFAQLLIPRLLNGWRCDTNRRGVMPFHKMQRLRYGLLWSLKWGNYAKLVR